jgi:hypothetical protein
MVKQCIDLQIDLHARANPVHVNQFILKIAKYVFLGRSGKPGVY